MSPATPRIMPRSAASAADLAPLAIARIELEVSDEDGPTVAALARRVVRTLASLREVEVRPDVVQLRAIAVRD